MLPAGHGGNAEIACTGRAIRCLTRHQ